MRELAREPHAQPFGCGPPVAGDPLHLDRGEPGEHGAAAHELRESSVEHHVRAGLRRAPRPLPLEHVCPPDLVEVRRAARDRRARGGRRLERLVLHLRVPLRRATVMLASRGVEIQRGELAVHLPDARGLTDLAKRDDRGEERVLGDLGRGPAIEVLPRRHAPELRLPQGVSAGGRAEAERSRVRGGLPG